MDKTPPQNLLIFVIGILSVASLVAVAPGFRAYYDGMRRTAVADRLERFSDVDRLEEVRAEWDRGLNSGRMPIGQAMAQLGDRGRTAFAPIRPQSGGDMNLDPLTGWTQLPHALPTPVVEAQAAAAAAAEEAARLEALEALQPEGEEGSVEGDENTTEAALEAAGDAVEAAVPTPARRRRVRPAPAPEAPAAPAAPAAPEAPAAPAEGEGE